MHNEQLNKAVEEISNLNDINASDLKSFIDRYPYCQSAQVLYAKKLYEEGSSSFDRQLHRASSMVYDRNVLFYIIEKMPIAEIVNAGYEDEIISQPEIIQEEKIVAPEENKIEEQESVSEEPLVIHDEISVESLNEMVGGNEEIETTEKQEEFSDVIQPEMTEENKQEVADDYGGKEEEIEQPLIDENIQSELQVEETEETQSVESENEEENIEEQTELISGDELIEELPAEEFTAADEILIDEELYEDPVAEENEEIEEEAEDEITKEELPYSTPDESVKIEVDKIEQDEPIFELPGYNIEFELGKLDEKDEIKIVIQKPEEETGAKSESSEEMPVNLSFSGWMNRLAGNSKAKVVELKKVAIHVSPQVEIKTEEAQAEAETEINTDEFAEKFAGELARKSIEPDDRLVTETYARILYMQGKYDKAIEVYKALSLKKTAKSDYFAALIEQIKKRK